MGYPLSSFERWYTLFFLINVFLLMTKLHKANVGLSEIRLRKNRINQEPECSSIIKVKTIIFWTKIMMSILKRHSHSSQQWRIFMRICFCKQVHSKFFSFVFFVYKYTRHLCRLTKKYLYSKKKSFLLTKQNYCRYFITYSPLLIFSDAKLDFQVHQIDRLLF